MHGSPDEKEVTEMIGKIIKHNKSLIHLNLEQTGLSSYIVSYLGSYLRRAGSALSVHLSGNQQGMTRKNKAALV